MHISILSKTICDQTIVFSTQAAALCFINTVVQTARGTNAKVYHQHEFLEAGFNPEEIERVTQ